jgi:hypothetical protein
MFGQDRLNNHLFGRRRRKLAQHFAGLIEKLHDGGAVRGYLDYDAIVSVGVFQLERGGFVVVATEIDSCME